MLYLMTGAPGSSKTLNAIKFVRDTFKDRQIYYYNINGLTLPWNLVTRDEVINWQDLPDGAVLVVDECQQVFPPRKGTEAVPAHISGFNTHRHRGFDFVLITQHPGLIDAALRRCVTEHWHFVRPFGMGYSRRYMWAECCNDPQSKSQQKTSIQSRVRFDKTIYGLYKSAEIHTAKPRVPPVIPLIGFMLVAIIALGYLYYSKHRPQDSATVQASSSQSNAAPEHDSGASFVTDVASQFLTKEQWLVMREPRIPGLPWTAPIYDELQKPVSFPRPQCVIFRKQCRCYTQQASRMDSISDAVCIGIVHNGYFDATKPDSFVSERANLTTRGQPAQANAVSARGPRVAVIPDSGQRTRPVASQGVGSMSRGARAAASYDQSLYFE